MMIRCGSIFVCCLLIIVNHSVDVTAECDITKCGVPKHYREIGCEPVKYAADDVEKCCPIEYNCEEIAKQDGAKCHYQGKSYSNGERIPDDIHCRASCRCDDGNIECAHIECPSEFDPPAPHCVQQRSEKECCSTNVICDEAVIATLPVCYLNGRKYHGGEKMFPKERCFSCFCDEKFDNATAVSQNPSCSEVNCAIDVNYLPRIRSGCAPIYFGEPTCCPIGIKCRKLNSLSLLLPS